jgi:hypothetical protein
MKSEKPKKPSRSGTSRAGSKRPAPARKATPLGAEQVQDAPLEVPPILLEGDAPPRTSRSGPGERYALGPGAVAAAAGELDRSLPEAYGTKKLLVVARDPHWLYAHWDLTLEQLRDYNSRSVDKHLVVRVFKDTVGDVPFAEVHVHPESRHWFIHVARGNTRFLGELGYYSKQRRWTRISVSEPTLTPPDHLSDDLSVQFETLPFEVSMKQLVALVKSLAQENQPLLHAMQEMRADKHPGLPTQGAVASSQWTPAQDRALAAALSIDDVRRVWIGSLEITELIRRQLIQDLSSRGAAEFSLPSSLSVTSLSSPFGGGMDRRKGFWFNVNAELIIYGATEPDATVTIGGRVIKLRSDGSFSYRFALPDGQYTLPAVATSSDGTDSRSAELRFGRQTKFGGEVGVHPQDPTLRPPKVENVS